MWRYVQNGQASAPVDTAALQTLLATGALSTDTYVWREGMTTWVAAKSLPEFAPRPPASAPPPSVPPQIPAAGGASGAVPKPPGLPANDADDIEKNRAFAIIAYLWILFVVGLVAAPQSKFAKYHCNQGLILFLASIIGSVCCMVIGIVPFVGLVLLLVVPALWVGWLVLVVVGIVNASGGQCKPLPLIGHFELIK